jgi:nucleoside-diphosphate-sugar epimerase
VSVARVLILGASGRLGGILRRHWSAQGATPVWQFRRAPLTSVATGSVHLCDPLAGLPQCGPVDVVLGLAGVVPAKGDVSLNSDLGLAAVDCAVGLRARHVFLSSSAAVYGPSTTLLGEQGGAFPVSAYGRAKLEMEQAALARAARHGIAVTALRIGNVAGADALLGQSGESRRIDQFSDGHGPVRSYIGPVEFARLVQALVQLACGGLRLPARLNLALEGGVEMADLCDAAGVPFQWHPAPETALQSVVLDVTQLARLVPLPKAEAAEIVADWHADRRCA